MEVVLQSKCRAISSSSMSLTLNKLKHIALYSNTTSNRALKIHLTWQVLYATNSQQNVPIDFLYIPQRKVPPKGNPKYLSESLDVTILTMVYKFL